MSDGSESHFLPPQPGPNRNVEVKARLDNLEQARETARNISTQSLGCQHQVDTYFHCQQGRLKLRVIDGQTGQLIWYRRPDEQHAKVSNYCILAIDDPGAELDALSAVLGVQTVVEKTREVFLVDNVRIHLDAVKDLGAYFELEAVLRPDQDEQAGFAQVESLCKQFGVRDEDRLAASYSDMIQ